MYVSRTWLAIPIGVLMAGCGAAHANDAWSKIVIRPDSLYQPLLQGPPQTHGLRSGRVVLAPGKAMDRHRTEANEEQLLFLQGQPSFHARTFFELDGGDHIAGITEYWATDEAPPEWRVAGGWAGHQETEQ